MTALQQPRAATVVPPGTPLRTTRGQVVRRRVLTAAGLLVVLAWAWVRAVPDDGAVANRGGAALLDDLGARALHPRLDLEFLGLVGDAVLVTLAFAAVGTAAAILIGLAGGLVLSDTAWTRRPPAWVRAGRACLRGGLVAARSVHELIWALLLLSVLGLDPLVAVLALAIPFGAQTAQVFAEAFDTSRSAGYAALRRAGAPRASALCYALVPAASPVLLSYGFYRFECALRSTVLLGFVGVGGLGQELVVSLSSRNWEEVWTLLGVLVLLSAAVEAWSARVRREAAPALVAPVRADGEGALAAAGPRRGTPPRRRPWTRMSLLLVPALLLLSWLWADLSWAGLVDPVTWTLTRDLLGELTPPALPDGGAAELAGAVLDTVATALLAMAVAVVVTIAVGPWAAGGRLGSPREAGAGGAVRALLRPVARVLLLLLRSVPPTVWAVLALLGLFPGIVPGAVALGLYSAGILGRLVAEAWGSLDPGPRDALVRAGTPGWLASIAAVGPPSYQRLVSYTLYRFEVTVRDSAVVGVVGAAGLGRLLAESLAAFRFPVVASLLVASFAVSAAVEVLGRRLRRALRA